MQLVTFVMNLPWTLCLLVAGLFSVPVKVQFHGNPVAIIIHVRGFWYCRWFPGQKGVRAMALGNIILLGPHLLNNDLEHELVHIRQHQRKPLIHPILNGIETVRHGYRQNKYEAEAYAATGSTYVEHKNARG